MTSILLDFEEYKTLVEQAPIMIWRSNAKAACDYFNERWLAFTGRSMEQEHGNGWTEEFTPRTTWSACGFIWKPSKSGKYLRCSIAFAGTTVFTAGYSIAEYPFSTREAPSPVILAVVST